MIDPISPESLLDLYLAPPKLAQFSLIDVRSEGEFAVGSIPGFLNMPILPNELRAQVGTCYKQHGQEAAINLGHSLVEPIRRRIVEEWLTNIAGSAKQEAIVHCWRGGLRSKIACEWMMAHGGRVRLLEGGYKGMRRLLLAHIARPKQLIMLSGLTGSNKTALLKEFPAHAVDLEGLALHRGSSFGLALGTKQPQQQYFENALGIELAKRHGRPILLEDESKLIGQCYLGPELFVQMTKAPRVVMVVPKPQRVANIVEQYVIEPLQQGFTPDQVRAHLLLGLARLKKPLGGLLYEQVRKNIANMPEQRFICDVQHHDWVGTILSNYYDKAYEYSFRKNPKNIIFTGSTLECQDFLQNLISQH